MLGFLAVLLGAFGAHALEGRLTPEHLEVWQTASRYHFYHSLALLALGLFALSGAENTKASVLLWTAGIIIFCGSLYLYALLGIKFFALIAPVGGLTLMAGWLALWRVNAPR